MPIRTPNTILYINDIKMLYKLQVLPLIKYGDNKPDIGVPSPLYEKKKKKEEARPKEIEIKAE